MKKIFIIICLLICISCGNNMKSADVDKTLTEIENSLDNEVCALEKMSEAECKQKVEEYLKVRFGRFAKVKKWTDFGKAFDYRFANVDGEVEAVVKGDKSTYTFQVLIDKFGTISSLQMNHIGTLDNYYHYSSGVRVDDNTLKNPVKYKGVTYNVVRITGSAILYQTAKKVSNNQIMDFIVNNTDFNQQTVVFQLPGEYLEKEYARYIGDAFKGILYETIGKIEKTYNVTINDNGTSTIKSIN